MEEKIKEITEHKAEIDNIKYNWIEKMNKRTNKRKRLYRILNILLYLGAISTIIILLTS
jgi:hypothetical protein